ncbi:type II CRISPR RNA-guided endonuclease Cas9 [Prevotella sp.]|uniref:type II CRISPR RNA-guided endonuclease Cas9 n=1 Tax=Prevotella sp. TaxID=59823 RepID=UPI003FD87D80
MKNTIGLDLGTNSIGWSVIQEKRTADDNIQKSISDSGSRIIPMDAAQLGDFAKGNTVSQTKDRTGFRGVRRLRERCLLRRERLFRVLEVMKFLPPHFASSLTRYGKFKDAGEEPKLAWDRDSSGKARFLFMESFNEMVTEFRTIHPELVANGLKVPYDWTIYYLRKKALSRAVTPFELAWIILNFNQKRGYYQLRGEEEQADKGKREEYLAQRVIDIIDTGEKKGKSTWFDVVLENGMVYHRAADIKPDWIGKVKEFIVTTPLDKDGSPKKDKEGNIKRSFRMPGDDDWKLQKKKAEKDIDNSGMTVGEYIYDALLHNPKQKIKGKLVRVVERKYYKEELRRIIEAQKKFIPQLTDSALYGECIEELYQSNEAYRQSVAVRNDFAYLFVDNIIFYQRPLKSKKSLIDNCPYETHRYIKDGEEKQAAVKCIAKSHPLFQEFRLWQFISNLRIYQRRMQMDDRVKLDVDVTEQYLPTEDSRTALFDYLNDKVEIKQDTLLKDFFNMKKPKGKDSLYPCRWNYVEDKTYPCNKTRGKMLARLKRAGIAADFLSDKVAEEHLWHILYSVEDKEELHKALAKFAEGNSLGSEFVDAFADMEPYKKEYGAYSAKALKKLLPLMRMGKYWDYENIDKATRKRIENIINGEYDENIRSRVREKAISLTSASQFRGLPLWMACYIVYDRHSEASDTSRWTTPEDIDRYLGEFKQHSLRNPVVEQVVTETLRTVRDIWKKYGKIDEIHVELGREMKNPANKRSEMNRRMLDNENANMRARILLAELMNPEFGIENVRPYSPSQQELLRIYEDGAISNGASDVDDEISAIMGKLSQTDVKKMPTRNEVRRYILWLEQNYRSPYTGEMIPLARLFTSAYEIEHVIPQSRYFDDSFSNKVICEAEVNKLKDRMLGYEFIKQHSGEIVQLSMGRTVRILSPEEYVRHVESQYKGNKAKMRKLLMDDIPDEFINRQLNDSRYISKLIISLLSNIVREEGEEETTSKNVICCNGSITDRLKKDWGINDVWNRIILPRFTRLNELTGTSRFTTLNTEGHHVPAMPLELQKGFSKKRIDHRHHAMDAIVIACTTRDHVNLLNNEAAMSKNNSNRITLSRKLHRYETIEVEKDGVRKQIAVAKEFMKPWDGFTADVEQALRNIVVSFKQNLRVINKTTNYYWHFRDGKKVAEPQTKGDSWAVRKPMHKETVFGEVNLRRIKEVPLKEALRRTGDIVDRELRAKLAELLCLEYTEKQIKKYFEENSDVWSDVNLKKIKIHFFTKETNERFFATRKPIDTSFTKDKIINQITDTAVQKIMLRHLEQKDGNAEEAFSPDGIEEMNRNIVELNDGKGHQPVYKVRVYEKADKFAVGQSGSKRRKFVEAAKGTNLFFAIYEEEQIDEATGESSVVRSYDTIPLNIVVDRQKKGLPSAPENERGTAPKYVLSPNDLVYIPTEEERKTGRINMPLDKERIYKMVSCTGKECHFVPYSTAKAIIDKVEYSKLNKIGRALTGEMIKEICIPISVSRIGEITLRQ